MALFGNQAASAAEGRRHEILVAVLRVIAEGGPDAVTHRRVAAVADVPLGSLTYYFASREELIGEAFRLYIAEATAFLLELEREIPPKDAAGLVALILEIMRREFAQADMIRAEYEMILHAGRDEETARAFAGYERNLEGRLAVVLEEMGAPKPHRAARTVLHLVRGYELLRLAGLGEEPAEFRARLSGVVESLVHGKAALAPALASHRAPHISRAAKSKQRRRS